MRKIKTLYAILIPWMVAFTCTAASAQVLLEEGKVNLNVIPGENITGKLTLHNNSGSEVDMKVYWEDFAYKPPFDGSKDFLPQGTTKHSLAGWVNIPSGVLRFPPFARKEVPYTINVPDDMQKGHYGVLFFEKQNREAVLEKGVNIVSRVGCLFFIEPKDKVKKVDLKNFRFTGKELTADFTNQGNVILIPDGTFYIIDQEGMVFDRGQIRKIYLPPGETGEYEMTLNADLDPGAYTLVMTIGLEEDDVVVKEIDFKKSYPSDFNIIEIRD
ncbi:MAG: hypothetical protein JW847_01905 [Candidatus Omnitrophica bacterium]|nr:hypothetical protein [Candidatus Omnitrophota bacterium]